jgi:hypothetical protein
MIRMSYQNKPSSTSRSSGFLTQLMRAVLAIGVLAIGAFVFAFSAAIILSIVLIAAAGIGIWLLQRKLRGLPSPFAVFSAWPPQAGTSERQVNPAAEPADDDWLSRTEKSVKTRAGVTLEGEVVDRA